MIQDEYCVTGDVSPMVWVVGGKENANHLSENLEPVMEVGSHHKAKHVPLTHLHEKKVYCLGSD